jgi:hypothetical protein
MRLDFQGPIVPGSISILVGNVAIFRDNGSGGFTASGTGTSSGSSISYLSGFMTLAFTVAPMTQPTTINLRYQIPTVINPTANYQNQIWHRFNTSLLGDTIQIGFTLNDAQMRNTSTAQAEIALHGIHLTIQPSGHLA